MVSVNVRFNSETYTRTYADNSTINDVLGDRDLKMAAGWGDNVRALVSGVEMPSTSVLSDGSTVVVETRANSKAE